MSMSALMRGIDTIRTHLTEKQWAALLVNALMLNTSSENNKRHTDCAALIAEDYYSLDDEQLRPIYRNEPPKGE